MALILSGYKYMKLPFSIALLFLSGLYLSGNDKPVNVNLALQTQPSRHVLDSLKAVYGGQSPPCYEYGIATPTRINKLAELAKTGDAQALECLWDELVFSPDSIIYFNPQLAYDVYKIAKINNVGMQFENEEGKLGTIKKCLEAGPFDWAAFRKKYNIPVDTLNDEYFSIWEIARQASLGREFGKPDPQLVLQLVCRGGSRMLDLNTAVSVAYNNWKQQKAVKFEPLDYVKPGAYDDGGYHFVGYIRHLEAEADLNWRVKTLIRSLKNNAGVYLAPAYKIACRFFEARQRGEEPNGGSGADIWAMNSIESQQTRYLDMLQSINRGKLPEPFQGNDSSDIRLNKIYNKVTAYLQKHPVTISGMGGEPDAEGIIEAQKRWLSYRDETAKILAIIKPDEDETSWKNWLTEVRTVQLWEMLNTAKELEKLNTEEPK